MYRRPVLCRICEFPVLDTGVQVSRLDVDKLSRWWLKTFETELDDDAATLRNSGICRFCICDASFQADLKEAKYEGCDWWTEQHVDKYYDDYYTKRKQL